jgi:hypothetical protein
MIVPPEIEVSANAIESVIEILCVAFKRPASFNNGSFISVIMVIGRLFIFSNNLICFFYYNIEKYYNIFQED